MSASGEHMPTMRALVAESNVVTRVTLRRILERLGFTVVELRDELAAACLLYQPESPELALLSLDTLLVDFEQVCRAMRDAKPDVYLVALVPENRRIDAAWVLDAGADDFIIKPTSMQEMEARLRVIKHVLAGDTHKSDVVESARKKPGRTIDVLLEELTDPTVLSNVFSQMDLEPVEEVDPRQTGENPVYSAWAPILILQAGTGKWLNVRIDLDDENGNRLLQSVHRQVEFSQTRLLRTLKDVMGLTEDVLRSAAQARGTAQLHLPLEPIAMPFGTIPKPSELASAHADQKLIGLRLKENLHLLMTLTMESIRLENPVISRLQNMDVLARDVQSVEYQAKLLRAGTMLNDTYIRKIQAFIHSQNLSQHIEVYRPPSGTVKFLEEMRMVAVA
ncbi:MAG: response regulator [Rhodothermales bacterium]